MASFNAFAQYYIVPLPKNNLDCVYCYQLHNAVSRTHRGGSYSIETYTMGMTYSCSTHNECIDRWQCHLNDNLYTGASYYYEDNNEPYDADGRTRDDGAADLNIDH